MTIKILSDSIIPVRQPEFQQEPQPGFRQVFLPELQQRESRTDLRELQQLQEPR